MKKSAQCPKCQSTRIGHLDGLPDTISSETEISWRHMSLVMINDQVAGLGRIEAYVCTECGYLEMYVVDPENVPFEAMKEFSWLKKPARGPYR